MSAMALDKMSAMALDKMSAMALDKIQKKVALFLPCLIGLPFFPWASSSMQLRALVGWCGWLLTTTESHSERFNTAFIPVSIFPFLLVYSVFR